MRPTTYGWYAPSTAPQRIAHAARLVAAGCQEVRWKAGGDDGNTWQQYLDATILQPYRDAGLLVTPWFFVWPTARDQQAIVRALTSTWSNEIAINPETEWRVSSSENPWRSLAEANAGARDWVRALRSAIRDATGREVLIAFSAVPTWADFPYEGFAAECDLAEPQHYWPDNAFPATDGETGDEAGEDEVEAHLRRAGSALPTIPIITLSREYDDDTAVGLALGALYDHPAIVGLSAWECGNAGFQWDAAARVWALCVDREQPQGGGAPRPLPPRAIPFGPYGAHLGGGFRDFYEAEPRALELWGYPLSEEEDRNGLTVQEFERARFEWHGDRVLLGRVVAETRGK